MLANPCAGCYGTDGRSAGEKVMSYALFRRKRRDVVAEKTGLTGEKGWCPINQKTFESKQQKDIHVIGDASIAGKRLSPIGDSNRQ